MRSNARSRVRAFAKLNLVLDVLGSLPGAYTEIATVFQTIDLCDELSVTVREGSELDLALSTRGLAIDCSSERNLAWRAAQAWAQASGWRGRIGIDLRKEIPPEAGLGGGSADAAAILWSLQRLLPGRLQQDKIAEIAAGLGADVPFLMQGGLALGTGKGDQIEPLSGLPSLPVVLVSDGPGLSTAEVYSRARRRLTQGAKAPKLQRFLHYLREDLQGLPPLGNDLLPAAMELRPQLRDLVLLLEGLGGLSTMTGSGSVVFALFERAGSARAAARQVEEILPAAWVQVVRTVSREEVSALREFEAEGEE